MKAMPINRTQKIVLTGGGSGGHITPLLSLAHALKQKQPDCNITYIGHKGDSFDSGQTSFHDFDFVAFVNAGKFRRYSGESLLSRLTDMQTILLNVRDIFRVVGSVGKAFKILSRVKPDVVFSKGGFVGVPVGIAAKLRGIPIVTHDSDVIPGLANRIIGRWAVIHATGMPAQFYDYPKSKTKYTGIPVDKRITQISHIDKANLKLKLGLNKDGSVLLVTGGGLGARDINDKFLKIVPELLLKYPDLHIIHIAGKKNEKEVIARYKDLLKDHPKKRVTILSYTPDFYLYSGAADLIITRAGATTLAEFAIQHKACILIPSPFLTGGHQVKNAENLKNAGAVEIVENDAPAQKLLNRITQLLEDSTARKELEIKLGSTAKKDASAQIADILLEVASTE
jgi:UDP-N-acetylglucosamine--N-acetylmuramyl-(pentapeptide) pyrophosphoryl-undecaprenol N-acetylglucosamine transferase